MSRSCVVVSFVVSFPGDEHYASSVEQLQSALTASADFSRVFVHVLHAESRIAFVHFMRFLSHFYTTLIPRLEPPSHRVALVVDPSFPLHRIFSDPQFGEPLGHVCAVCGKHAVVDDFPQPPKAFCTLFSRHEFVAVEPRFDNCVLGGTFDRLHNGHRVLLGCAVAVSKRCVTVGITSDAMIAASKKAYKEFVEPYADRRDGVRAFIRNCNPDLSDVLAPIDDAFGPSTVDPNLQCIIVTEETAAGGEAVNKERARKGLSELQVLIVDCFDRHAEKLGSIANKISSTDERRKLAEKAAAASAITMK